MIENMRYRKKDHLLVMGEWYDTLITCPSQCKLPITYRRRNFTLYLRWRWSDPWTAAVIENPDTSQEVWHRDLEISFYSHDQLAECKKDAIEKASALIPALVEKQPSESISAVENDSSSAH